MTNLRRWALAAIYEELIHAITGGDDGPPRDYWISSISYIAESGDLEKVRDELIGIIDREDEPVEITEWVNQLIEIADRALPPLEPESRETELLREVAHLNGLLRWERQQHSYWRAQVETQLPKPGPRQISHMRMQESRNA